MKEKTTATVTETDAGWHVQIDTPGDERELTIYINRGLLFQDYPDFAITPAWRMCPECGVSPRHKDAIYYCAWCGHKLPDYTEADL